LKIYHHEIPLVNGFKILDEPKDSRLVRGRRVSAPPGHTLYKNNYNKGTLFCFCCGCKADRWIAEKHKQELIGNAMLNLYGNQNNNIVMMNRDHIIPRSLGGANVIENLRVACEACNSKRGNALDENDFEFARNNLHLIDVPSYYANYEKAKQHSKTNIQSKAEVEKSLAPFKLFAPIIALVSK
jgi:hypothetical protein